MIYRTAALVRIRGLVLAVGVLAIVLPRAGGIDFARDLKPVLEAKCLGCHNPNNTKGELSLHAPSDRLGDLIDSAHPEKSRLLEVTRPGPDGARPEMPEKGEPLTEAERSHLREWVLEGARWPEGLVLHEASKADQSWWAYRALRPLAELEAVAAQTPSGNPIDGFIDLRLREGGLTMNPAADRRALIRRATYDLTGLPPASEEVEAFVGSTDPLAYERLIDRLLDSPRYGERWGRHWLDVVRFGESRGYERNQIIDDAWPFRDYVIRSLNEDKPFDRLIREHIAGDVFGRGNPEVEIGSAFLVAGPYDDVRNQDAAQAAQIRANTLDEIISATGEAFLGMTLGCARCHDHKFDPIRQADYYGLYATFAGVRHGSRAWATKEQSAARAARLKPLNDRKSAAEAERRKIEAVVLARARTKESDYAARWTRPPVNRAGTEERFPPVNARWIRLICDGNDANPNTTNNFNLDEFEVWSSDRNPRNVALSSNGARASGRARTIADFPDAYGPQLAIDGAVGRRFIATGGSLTIELPRSTRIDRVLFSSARGEEVPSHSKFLFVADYRIEVSLDGLNWTEVANGNDRQPVSPLHRNVRWTRLETHSDEHVKLGELRREIGRVAQAIKAVPDLPSAWLGSRSAADAKGPFHVFTGGDAMRKGTAVVPASLSTLARVTPSYQLADDADESARRDRLAGWITDIRNPLTARVLANRLWHYHFGTGIVDTPNDFGFMGGRPTHPALLDFLARQLHQNDWRIKALHKLIMTSAAYRQSSAWRSDAAAVDVDSRLLWRFPPRRLAAEEIRDTLLQVAGKLDVAMGGPGFRLYEYQQDNVSTYVPLAVHGPETYRRAVYHQNARAAVVDLMTEFDQPDCAFPTPRRAETTTPLQALTMLNHQFTLEMATALSKRIESSAPGDAGAQTRRLFALAYQRPPTAGELRRVVEAIASDGLRSVCRAVLNSNELIYVD
jgi:hypothetical protein